MSETKDDRVLRIGIVREGRLVQEKRLRRPGEVSIGRSKKCTLQLAGDAVPESVSLFVMRNDRLHLRLSRGMGGSVVLDDEPVDVERLVSSGKATRDGDAYLVSTDLCNRGKIAVGGSNILFQFIVPPRASRKARLRSEGHWESGFLSRLFGGGGSGDVSIERGHSAATSRVPENRVLRVGIIQDGQIVQEKLVRKAGDVTIGKSGKCSLRLPIPSAPDCYLLFQFRDDRYYLRFTSRMTGKVSIGDKVMELSELRESLQVEKKGDYYFLPFTDKDRGKLVFGDFNLLFQFVIPPRPVAAEELRSGLGGLAATVEKFRVWASLVSTGKQSRGVLSGLRVALAGALFALLGTLFLPLIEEHTVQFHDASRFMSYGWGPGRAVLMLSGFAFLSALSGIAFSKRKLFAAGGIFLALIQLAAIIILPFVVRGHIREMIANGTYLPMTQLSTDVGFQFAFFGVVLQLIGFIWAMIAKPIYGPDDRVLKVDVLWHGTPLKQSVFAEKRDITAGVWGNADFVLPVKGGKPTRLFRVDREGQYWLALLDGMHGKINIDGEVSDVSDFAHREGAKVGGVSYVQVANGDWGMLDFGSVMLRFSFVRPPRSAAGRKRALNIDSLQYSVFVSTVFTVAALFIMAQFLWDPSAGVEKNKSELRTMKVEINLAQEKAVEILTAADEGEGAGKDGASKFTDDSADIGKDEKKDKPKEKAAARELTDEERRAQAAKNVANKSIVGQLDKLGIGKMGTGPSAMTAMNNWGNSQAGNMMAVYSDGPGAGGGVGIAAGERISGGGSGPMGVVKGVDRALLPGGGKGGRAIKAVATKGETDTAGEVGPRIRTGGNVAGMTGGKVDKASLESVFRRRMSAIQTCYQQALKVNPNLAGKVTIRFTIGTAGTVTDISVADNSTGDSSVGACIIQKVRTWPFPAPEGGAVTVVFPVLLQTGG